VESSPVILKVLKMNGQAVSEMQCDGCFHVRQFLAERLVNLVNLRIAIPIVRFCLPTYEVLMWLVWDCGKCSGNRAGLFAFLERTIGTRDYSDSSRVLPAVDFASSCWLTE
jgi:hypothetical protein